MWKKKKTLDYDREQFRPVLRCSICTGEQVGGLQEIRTGKFQEIMLIRTPRELQAFLDLCGVTEAEKIY